MRNAILLHGKPDKEEYYDAKYPSASNAHWLPWLQKQLLIHDIAAATPEAPLAYDPQYELWAREADRYEITSKSTLVGHSCGGGFWVRYLSEHPEIQAGKVILVAPSLGYGWDDRQFFDFEIDPKLTSRTKGIIMFISDDDDHPSVPKTVQTFMNSLQGSTKKEFTGYGHFTFHSMKTNEFPELLREVLA